MAHDGCHCFLFWAIFCPFNFLTTQKTLEVLSFYTSVPKIMIICYSITEIWHITSVIDIFHFGLFFAPLPPYNSQKNKNLRKREKMPGDIVILLMCTKIMIR